MAAWEDDLAFRHAPLILQKVHPVSPRSDYLTRADFASDWGGVWKNWEAVFGLDAGGQPHAMPAYVYYSVVETPSHYFLLYALYHPQDWQALWGAPTQREPDLVDEHRHDMEGCLAVVPRNPGDTDSESCAALVTVAHYNLEKHAGWQLQDGSRVGTPCWLKPQWHDRPVLESTRFAGEPGEPRRRFKLYVDACGHAVRGSARGWGNEDHVVRYRPSVNTAEEPRLTGFAAEPGDPARIQTVTYRLINMFDSDGLWPQRDNPQVFQLGAGHQRAAFAVRKAAGSFAPGSANPPWAWLDDGVQLPAGLMATDPARLTAFYFYCKAPLLDHRYLHNPYQGIVKPAPVAAVPAAAPPILAAAAGAKPRAARKARPKRAPAKRARTRRPKAPR
jgi:hypothetical protein